MSKSISYVFDYTGDPQDLIIGVAYGAGRAYVADGRDGTVSVIDNESHAFFHKISFPVSSPIYASAIAVSSTETVGAQHGIAYVSDSENNRVFSIDVLHNMWIGFSGEVTGYSGSTPCGMATSPDGVQIYVANRKSRDISVIDVKANSQIGTIDIDQGTGYAPNQIACTSTGIIVTTNLTHSSIRCVDTRANKRIFDINIGDPTTYLAIRNDKQAYVSTKNGLCAVNLVDNTTTKVEMDTEKPYIGGIAFNPSNNEAYVARREGSPNRSSIDLLVLDTTSNNIARIINIASSHDPNFDIGMPTRVVVDSRTSSIYVGIARPDKGTIAVVPY